MEPSNEPARPTRLRLNTTNRADGTVCLTVDGDVDMTTSDYFRQTVIRLVDDPTVSGLTLDAADLSFIDSNGVTVLVKAYRAAGERGTSFGITNTREPVRGLLEMLGVYDMLTQAQAV